MSEILWQLLQSERSLFLRIDTTEAEFHSSGKSTSKILLNNKNRHLHSWNK